MARFVVLELKTEHMNQPYPEFFILDICISIRILQRATSLFSLNVRKQTAIGLKSGGGAQ